MKKIKKILCVILSALMMLSINVPAFAIDTANNTADTGTTSSTGNGNLKIEVITDKDSYKVLNVATFTVIVTNTSNEAIQNVSAEAVFSDLAPVKKGITKAETESLEAGESLTLSYKATLNKNEHNLNIFQKIFLWIVRLFNGGYTASDNGFNDGRDYTEQITSLMFGKFQADNVVRVWYKKENSNNNDKTVSRRDWILKLSDTCNWAEQIENMDFSENNSFIDISGADCEKAVEYALLNGYIDKTSDNFFPDAPATREFATVTAIRAMQFYNTIEIDCADKNLISYPEEVYSAVNIGLLYLENNFFYPNRNLTENECTAILANINEINNKTDNTENTEEIVYSDNFVELSSAVKYTQENDTFIFEKTDETKHLREDSIFFVNNEYYKVKTVNEENGKYIVETQEPSLQEIFEHINIGGNQDLTVGDFITADGVEIVEQPQTYSTRSSINITDFTLKLDKEIIDDVKFYGSVGIKNPRIDYSADIDFKWGIVPFVNAHFKLAFDLETKIGISDERKDKAPLKDGALTLGHFPVFGVAGIGIYIEVALAYTVEGKAQIIFTTAGETGFQICNNIPRYITDFSSPQYDVSELEASVKAGPKISGLLEITKKWKLIDFSLFAGPCLSGELKIRDTGLVCLNASVYLFAKFEAMQESVIGDWLDIKASWDIWDDNNSPIKKELHFENFIIVPECTYFKWSIDDNGVLIIRGEGAMPDFSLRSAPWYERRNEIKEVIIDNGITSIGTYAFFNCTTLTKVTIPDSVIKIGDGAFEYCTSITELKLPDKLTELGAWVFSTCTSLNSIDLSNSLTKMGAGVFKDCYNLKSLTLPASINYIAHSGYGYAPSDYTYLYTNQNYDTYQKFYGRYQGVGALGGSYIETVTIADGATIIPEYLFSHAMCLKNVNIPNSVTSIGTHAFSYCKSLENIAIPNSVTSIGDYAFYNCTILGKITIPNSVTNIGNYAFSNCNFENITFPDSVTKIGDGAFEYCTSITELKLPEKLTELGMWAFSGCTSLNRIDLGSSLTKMGAGVFKDCYNLKSLTLPASIDYITLSVYTSHLYANQNYDTYQKFNGWYNGVGALGGSYIETVTIAEGATTIPAYVFNCAMCLKNIIIPDSVTSIGDYAFCQCKSLEDITIPDSVTKIGDGAFEYCTSITELKLPDKLTELGAWVFSTCTSLNSIDLSNSLTIMGAGVFKDCYNLKSLTLPASINYISRSGYGGVTPSNDTYLYMNQNYDTYQKFNGRYQWAGALGGSYIETVTIADGATIIPEYLFSHAMCLKNVNIPNSVTSIGTHAFSYCKSLENIAIPNTVTSIGYYAFFNCTILEKITIPNSVTNIGNYAFSNCNFENITISDNVTKIGDGAFEYCTSITELKLPDKLTELGAWAFSGCTSLNRIDLGSSLTKMGAGVFKDCYNLKSLTLPASINYITTSISVYLYTNQNYDTYQKFYGRYQGIGALGGSYIETVTIADGATIIPAYLFSHAMCLKNVNIPNSVTSIGTHAFSYCKSLENIAIPNSVTSIGDYAFYNCTSLASIAISNSSCTIYDGKNTIASTAVIYGYAGSTAEAYAQKYGREFVAIG